MYGYMDTLVCGYTGKQVYGYTGTDTPNAV